MTGPVWVQPVADGEGSTPVPYVSAPAYPTGSLFDPTAPFFEVFTAPVVDLGAVDNGSAIAGAGGGGGNPNAGIDSPAPFIANSDYNAIGQVLGATPGATGAPNGIQIQAVETLMGDTLENTVSASNLSIIISNAMTNHFSMEFVDQNDVQIGGSLLFSAPTPFVIPPAAASALAVDPITPGEFITAAQAVMQLGPVLAGQPEPLSNAFGYAAGLEPAGSAAQTALATLASNVAYGPGALAQFSTGGLNTTFNHWGAVGMLALCACLSLTPAFADEPAAAGAAKPKTSWQPPVWPAPPQLECSTTTLGDRRLAEIHQTELEYLRTEQQILSVLLQMQEQKR